MGGTLTQRYDPAHRASARRSSGTRQLAARKGAPAHICNAHIRFHRAQKPRHCNSARARHLRCVFDEHVVKVKFALRLVRLLSGRPHKQSPGIGRITHKQALMIAARRGGRLGDANHAAWRSEAHTHAHARARLLRLFRRRAHRARCCCSALLAAQRSIELILQPSGSLGVARGEPDCASRARVPVLCSARESRARSDVERRRPARGWDGWLGP